MVRPRDNPYAGRVKKNQPANFMQGRPARIATPNFNYKS